MCLALLIVCIHNTIAAIFGTIITIKTSFYEQRSQARGSGDRQWYGRA